MDLDERIRSCIPRHPALRGHGEIRFPALAGLAEPVSCNTHMHIHTFFVAHCFIKQRNFGARTKHLGWYFGCRKPPCGDGGMYSLALRHKAIVSQPKQRLGCGEDTWAVFLLGWKALREWGHALPSFGAGWQSNLVPPGSDVRGPNHRAKIAAPAPLECGEITVCLIKAHF